MTVQPPISPVHCKTLNNLSKACYPPPVVAAMKPRRFLDSFPRLGCRPSWSYLHTGTLLRLISFICHSYENTRGVEVFLPFWSVPACGCFEVPTLPYLPKSLPLNLFADHHPLTPFVTISYKNGGGEGAPSGCSLPQYPPKSNRIILFADHHPLTIIESYRYKNSGGRGEETQLFVDVVFCFQPLEQRSFLWLRSGSPPCSTRFVPAPGGWSNDSHPSWEPEDRSRTRAWRSPIVEDLERRSTVESRWLH